MTADELETAYLDGRITYQDMEWALSEELGAADKLFGGMVGDAMELILEAGRAPGVSILPELVAKADRPDLLLVVVAKLAAAFVKSGGDMPWLGLLAAPLWEGSD